jgi:hypothetical protein
MAHFARVDNGIVREVIVVKNDDALDEAAGLAFISSLGLDGVWVQTSYNGNPIDGQDRGPFAGIGFSWDGYKFISPVQPADEVAN